VEGVEVGVVSKDLYDPVKDRSSRSLRGLVVLSHDKNATVDCPRGGVKDIRGRVSGLTVVAEHLYREVKKLPTSVSFFVAVVGLIAWIEHRDGSHDVCSVYCGSLDLPKGLFVWGGECGLSMRRGVVVEGRHERERMSLRSRSLLLLTVWTFPPWA
jgi:hypothetical protein